MEQTADAHGAGSSPLTRGKHLCADAVAWDQGLIPAQEPEQVIPLIHATVMGGRPTPSDPEQRRAYLESLDAFVLRAVGARQPAHAVPTIAQPRATEPLEGAEAPGSLRHSAVG